MGWVWTTKEKEAAPANLTAIEFNGCKVLRGQGMGLGCRNDACMAWEQTKPKAEP
jgi:hypothetical protein